MILSYHLMTTFIYFFTSLNKITYALILRDYLFIPHVIKVEVLFFKKENPSPTIYFVREGL